MAQLLELDALDDLPVAHVEARDDALGQHSASARRAPTAGLSATSRKFRRICRPTSPDFSGWNCTPNTLPRSTTAANVSRMRRRGDAVVRDRRGVRVREVDLRTAVEARAADASGPREVERIPADMRNLQALLGVAAQPRRRVLARTPSPGTSGASSLPSNSHCMPRQMPSSGVPAPHGVADRVAPRPVERRGRREVADAGHDDRRRRRAAPLVSRGVTNSAPSAVKRLAHRREVAGAVVDERDHSSPFVLGSIFARRASCAQATRSARANALKTASM